MCVCARARIAKEFVLFYLLYFYTDGDRKQEKKTLNAKKGRLKIKTQIHEMKTEKHKTRATNWAKKANEKTVWVRNGLVLLSHSQCAWCMFFMHLYFRSLGLNFGSGFSFLSTTFVCERYYLHFGFVFLASPRSPHIHRTEVEERKAIGQDGGAVHLFLSAFKTLQTLLNLALRLQIPSPC